jgi:dienelactone hydrolase
MMKLLLTLHEPAGKENTMKYLLLTTMMMALALNAHAAILTEIVEYKQGDTVLEGYLAYDDAIKGARPGVLVVHEWWGINNYTKQRTEQLAALGYIAFAADIYGKGVRTTSPQEAMALSGKYRGGSDRSLLRSRTVAGLDTLRKHPLVDPKRITAIGYCFGGTAVLELARSGADISGVVSFHGGLATPNPADAKNIKAKVLVLAGADDPYVKPEEVLAFEDEMRKGGVDWYVTTYSNSVHGFTNPANGGDNSKGMAYNEKADKRSWQAMKDFFAEIIK